MLIHCSTNVVPVIFIARTSLICDVTIMRATADVKPEETGPDTKSKRNPTEEDERDAFNTILININY